MTNDWRSFLRADGLIIGLVALSQAMSGQASLDKGAVLTTDWTSRHIVFSQPATAGQAQRLQREWRYWQQRVRHIPARVQEVADDALLATLPFDANNPNAGNHSGGQWLEDLGTGASVGALNYPAKYGFRPTTANCGNATNPDFVVFGTGLMGVPGPGGQASIAAYENLYSGCTGTVPQVYWAYNTGGQVTTSPVFSQDGTQVAFIQTNGSGDAQMVVLRWAASTTETVSNPMTLPRLTNSQYFGCTAPCMTTGVLVTVAVDANSSVFYDYNDDTAYVGDESGYLHKINPVFKGVPAEVTSAGWPVQLNPGAPTTLTSPVYDPASAEVFVADAGGYLYRVGPGTAFVAQSGQLDFSSARDSGPGIVQGPIVDSTAELVYVFATSDGSGSCVGGADCTAVYQLPVNFPENAKGTKALVGASTLTGSTPSPMHLGAFDSTYENSANATGNLYVCGNTGGPPILYQVPLNAGTFGTVNPGPVLSTSSITPCSPVSDILNPNATGGATEWMFASAENGGASSGCASGGCVFNFQDTPWLANTTYAVGQEILDNHFQIHVVIKAGTSGASMPAWAVTAGNTTVDGTATWIDQGVQSAFTPGSWTARQTYAKGAKILVAGNIQFVTKPGISGATEPAFNATAGRTTTDATVTWRNLGAIATAALSAAGGTSGIIIDNTLGSGTLAGASQVYFSTLSNQACGTTGTGGCAEQASQAALK